MQLVMLNGDGHSLNGYWRRPEGELFITWRLYGSLANRIYIPKKELSKVKVFVAFDRLLDSGMTGPIWLKDPRIAEVVVSALQAAHEQNLITLHAYVVMPNHVHILLEPNATTAKIAESIQGVTARHANRILGRGSARFWEVKSFDYPVRNSDTERQIHTHIENDPVTAGLVKKPPDWPWSSVSRPIDL
jgi:putative transposase